MDNFTRRLETLHGNEVDVADMMDHVLDLAKRKMDERELRNIITTRRQFIKWKRQQPKGDRCLLNYKMMEEGIIQPAAVFDVYLENCTKAV